ncbi:MAG: hypothetical protein WDN31_20580 [Hyphomicrobium sp.]
MDPWSGLYGGVHGGYGWGNADYDLAVETVLNERMRHDLDHGVIGGQLGLQRQFGHVVAGVEVTYSWLNQSDTLESQVVFGRIRNIEIDQLFTATGRLGYAHGDYLAYVKGGYAGSDIDTSISRADSINPPSTTSGWVERMGHWRRHRAPVHAMARARHRVRLREPRHARSQRPAVR